MLNSLRNKTYHLLRRSEGFFKTDMIYLTKGGFWITTAQIAVSFSSFLLAIAFAHFVTKEDFGQYKYIISIAGLLGAFTLTGLPSAVLRAASRGYNQTLTHAFWKNLKWSVAFCGIALSMAIYYFIKDNQTLGVSLLILGSLWPILQSTNLYNSYLIAKKDFRRNALYFEIIGNIFPIACLLITMYLTSNPVWLVATFFVSNTAIGLILYKRVVSLYPPTGGVDPEALSYSKHLSLINILNGIANNLDQILIFHYIGAAELAIYNFAIAIPNQTKGPLKGISNLMFPKFVEREESEIHAGIKHKYFIMFISSLTLAVAYILLAPYIFQLFFPNYSDAIIYSQIFAISLLAVTFNPADIYFAAKKKVRQQYIVNISGALVQILATFIGVIYWGLMGLIVARVITRLLNNITSAVIYQWTLEK